jgi:uncharacterized membrane protein
MKGKISAKEMREERLRWQSWTVVGIVAAGCAYDLLANRMGPCTPAYLRLALALSCCLGLLVYFLRAATCWGSVLGALITFQLLTLVGVEGDSPWHTCLQSGLVPELVLFLLTWLATQYGRSRKQILGLAEKKTGRTAGQIAANLGPSILALLVMQFYIRIFFLHSGPQDSISLASLLLYPYKSFGPSLCTIALLAAMAEATADTLSSELGQVLGGDPWMITSFRRVPIGTDGATSISGSVAGILGALMVALAGTYAFHLNLFGCGIAFAAAVIGLFLDSLLGATLEQRGWLNNDAVNFFSGSVALKIAALITVLEIGKILIV